MNVANTLDGLQDTDIVPTLLKVRESVLLNIDYLDDVTNDVTDGALGNKGEHAGVISGHWKVTCAVLLLPASVLPSLYPMS